MTTQNRNVPALRFPEFQGDWNEAKLSKVGEIIGGGTPDTTNSDFWGGDIYWFTPTEIKSKYIRKSIRTITAKGLKNSSAKLLPKGTLLFSSRATVGDVGIATTECCTNQGFQSIVVNENNINEFIYYWIVQNKNEFVTKASGSTFLEINKTEISKLKIKLPTLPEQQKIVAFLTAVDEKIQQLAEKKDFLERYKKGVMQKIFNQEIRFKDDSGNDFADWDLKELKQIAVRVTAKNRSNEINKVLTNSATKGIVNQQDYFDKDIANQNNLEGYYIVEKDDFVYNPRISSFAPVGPIKRNNLEKGLMSPLYSVFRFKDINLNFIEQFFETKLWHDYLKSIANYGARHDRMNITVEDFFDMPILLPSKAEQEKIAGFLSSIDDKINSVNQQLEKTKKYKKGLLQQMFV